MNVSNLRNNLGRRFSISNSYFLLILIKYTSNDNTFNFCIRGACTHKGFPKCFQPKVLNIEHWPKRPCPPPQPHSLPPSLLLVFQEYGLLSVLTHAASAPISGFAVCCSPGGHTPSPAGTSFPSLKSAPEVSLSGNPYWLFKIDQPYSPLHVIRSPNTFPCRSNHHCLWFPTDGSNATLCVFLTSPQLHEGRHRAFCLILYSGTSVVDDI